MSILLTLRAVYRDTRGAAIVYSAIAFPAIIGFLSLGVDAGMVYYYKGRLQNAADAAALAGAAVIPKNTGAINADERDDIVSEAQTFSEKNMVTSKHNVVLKSGDIEAGHWDSDGSHGPIRAFYSEGDLPQGVAINAVRVSTRRAQANSNPLLLGFASMFGYGEFNLSVSAIATSTTDKNCLTTGFTALGIAEGGSQNTILDGFCIHGEDGVKFGSQNCMEGGEDADSEVIISMPNPGAGLGSGGYDLGSDNEVVSESMCNDGVYSNNNLPNNVQRNTIGNFVNADDFIFDLTKPAGDSDHVASVRGKIDFLRANHASELPPGVAASVVVTSEDYAIPSDSVVSNRLIISDKKITVGSNVELTNVFLLAKENVEFGSDVTIGSPNFCDNQTGQVFILAGEEAKFGSNNEMYGSQVIAGKFVDYGSDNADFREVSVLSGGDIKFGSQWTIRGCGASGVNNTLDPGLKTGRIARLVR